uniref:Uncharacterized protein n=1 Tax=Physcomitrium patens TaxID=3218 RepID=A0A2K1L7K6_PHYPA|nr:hypothetical protein PHYPA_000416 [Physcomitrium patens]
MIEITKSGKNSRYKEEEEEQRGKKEDFSRTFLCVE